MDMSCIARTCPAAAPNEYAAFPVKGPSVPEGAGSERTNARGDRDQRGLQRWSWLLRVVTCLSGWVFGLHYLPGLAAQAAPRHAIVEDLRIDNAKEDLASIGTLVVTRSGNIVVDQPSDHSIRFFDVTGRPLVTFGRSGEGPGEFQRVIRMGIVSDTIWVWDAGLARLTLVSADGHLAGISRFTGLRPDAMPGQTIPLGSFPTVEGRYPTGELLVIGIPFNSHQPSAWKVLEGMTTILGRFRTDGALEKVVVGVPLVRRCLPIILGMQVGLPACSKPLEAHASDGSGAVLVTTLLSGDSGGSYSVTRLNGFGDTLFVRSYPFRGVTMTRQRADSIRAKIASPGQSGPLVDALRALPLPPVLPPIRRVLLGRDKSIWLLEQGLGNSWLILDPEGRAYCRIIVPHGVRVEQGQLDAFWATSSDADGLESIVRYRISTN